LVGGPVPYPAEEFALTEQDGTTRLGYSGEREAIELAFVAGLQRLPPAQAAALALADVLGFRTPEVADMLGSSPAAVKGSLQRARRNLDRLRRTATRRRSPAPAGSGRSPAGSLQPSKPTTYRVSWRC